MKLKIFFIHIFLLLVLFAELPAQINLSLRHLDIEKGLSNNSVRTIFQDSKGYMWFGTFDGLNRYDGYDFRIFRHTIDDSLSLPHNYINTICEDLDNKIWVGTGQGIGIYNNLSSNFQQGKYWPNDGRPLQRIHYNINNLQADELGNVFIGTNGGGLLVSIGGKNEAIQVPCIKDKNGICGGDVQSIVIDKQQRVFMFILNIGLCLYDLAKNETRLISNQITAINCMEVDDLLRKSGLDCR